MQQRNKSWDSDAKNLMSDGNVQIVKTGEVIGATQLTEGELIVELWKSLKIPWSRGLAG